MKVKYQEVDIASDGDAAERVMLINRGYRSVPTIVFPDGTHLTEPQVHVLKDKLAMYV